MLLHFKDIIIKLIASIGVQMISIWLVAPLINNVSFGI